MYLLNLSLGQFLVLFGSVSAVMVALYLLDRSRRRQVVSTLRFWTAAQQQPPASRRKRIQQPWSLILQLISMALILLAISQLRWGMRAAAPRDHVLILETSAWMAAAAPGSAKGPRTLMDLARERARAYIRAVPGRDRIMLVRADALTTPATAFEPDRRKLEAAINESQPGSTALNLDQALAFARHIQSQGGRRGGEIVFIGTGKIAEREAGAPPPPANLRYIPVADSVENCGLRKIGVRRSASEPDVWEILVSARNYGSLPRNMSIAVAFGASSVTARNAPVNAPVGAENLTLAPGAERECTFRYRTRAAGVLEARLFPHDSFPEDDQAALELPARRNLRVTVYSEHPDLLRPLLSGDPRVNARFRSPSEYSPETGAPSDDRLVVLDRFRPPAPPNANAVWIDPPQDGSPIPIRARVENVPFAHWLADDALTAGLRAKDFKLESASVFEAAPGDIRIGEVESGPVIVARPGKLKTVVIGFHPALSNMRYELTTPLLFADLLRWMSPEMFRRLEFTGGSVGTVKVMLDEDTDPAHVRVMQDDGTPVPFTARDRIIHFFEGSRGTVRVVADDHEYVYSLTLPQLWESRWEAPPGVRRGVPGSHSNGADYTELWHWLAILGTAGLVVEWFLYGRFSRGMAHARRAVLAMRRAS